MPANGQARFRILVLGLAVACFVATGSADASPGSNASTLTPALKPEEAGRRMMKRATGYLKARKYDRALRMFEKALPLRPRDVDLLGYLVTTAARLGRNDRVILYGLGYGFSTSDAKQEPEEHVLKAVKASAVRSSKRLRRVVVATRPPAVRLSIDHVPIGRSPIAPVNLMPGRYTLRAVRDGYHDATETLVVTEGQGAQTIDVTLVAQKRHGFLKVVTTPSAGVAVHVDGKTMGVTPMRTPIQLAVGKRLVVFNKAGFDVWQRYVRVREGRTTTLAPVLERLAK